MPLAKKGIRGWVAATYRAWADILRLDRATPDPAGVDLLVFDIDGVLLDCTSSYPNTISAAVQAYVRDLGWRAEQVLLPASETHLWKQAGGFNSDWALAQAALYLHLGKGVPDTEAARRTPPLQDEFLREVARRGGGLAAVRALLPEPPGWDPGRVTRLCCALYAGERCQAMFGFPASGTGFCETERPLLAPDRLLAWPGPVGIYTGREDGETAFALERLGLAGRLPAARVVTSSSGFRKPDPGGLRAIARHAGARRALYVGDNIDDLKTVEQYRAAGWGEPEFGFAGILGGALGGAAEEVFRAGGADLIAPATGVLLAALLGARALPGTA